MFRQSSTCHSGGEWCRIKKRRPRFDHLIVATLRILGRRSKESFQDRLSGRIVASYFHLSCADQAVHVSALVSDYLNNADSGE